MWHFIYNTFFRHEKNDWLFYLSQGLILVLVGLIILFFPEILVAFIASIFLLIGFSVIVFAFHIKKYNRKYQRVEININD